MRNINLLLIGLSLKKLCYLSIRKNYFRVFIASKLRLNVHAVRGILPWNVDSKDKDIHNSKKSKISGLLTCTSVEYLFSAIINVETLCFLKIILKELLYQIKDSNTRNACSNLETILCAKVLLRFSYESLVNFYQI